MLQFIPLRSQTEIVLTLSEYSKILHTQIFDAYRYSMPLYTEKLLNTCEEIRLLLEDFYTTENLLQLYLQPKVKTKFNSYNQFENKAIQQICHRIASQPFTKIDKL